MHRAQLLLREFLVMLVIVIGDRRAGKENSKTQKTTHFAHGKAHAKQSRAHHSRGQPNGIALPLGGQNCFRDELGRLLIQFHWLALPAGMLLRVMDRLHPNVDRVV